MSWIDHARKYLTFNNLDDLAKARGEGDDADIKALIEELVKNEGVAEDFEKGFELAEKLKGNGEDIEADTVTLLLLNEVASMAGSPERFPPAEKGRLIEMSFRACETCIQLAEMNGFREVKANYLAIIGTGLTKNSSWNEARQAYSEALEIRRKLEDAEPHIYKPYVATTLNNLGIVLNSQRAFAEARQIDSEALEIYRELAEAEPQIYKPDVATTLNNLGVVLWNQRAFSEARQAYSEALDIRRELAEAEPHIYKPYVATTLNNLGAVLTNQRAFAEAKQVYSEVLYIFRELAKTEPHIYKLNVATTLNNLGAVLANQRAFVEARQAFSEALEISRELAEAEPYIYEPYEAGTLNNLGNVLRNQRAFSEARQAYSEALDIYRKLAEAEPHIYKPYMATTLNNLGNVLRNQRAFSEARQAFSEALEIYRELAEAEPHIYKPYKATTLNNLGIVLDDQRAFVEARQAYSEALEISRELADVEPHIYKPDVAMTANNLALTLEGLDMHSEAMAYFREAVAACEDKSIPYKEVYLARGDAENSYRRMIAHFAEQDDADSLFNHVVALREPNRLPPGGALEIAALEIAATGDKLGHRSIKALIVEQLRDGTFLGVFGWSQNEPLKWELVPGLIKGWDSFWDKYWKWRKHINALKKKAREGDIKRVKRIEAAIPAAIDELKNAAAQVWDSLPEWIKDFLMPGSRYEICISATSWAAFPFEMLRFDEGEDDYIGLHRALPRIHGLSAGYWAGMTDRLLGGGNKKLLLYADPTSDLDSCGYEAKGIEANLKGYYQITKRLQGDATDINLSNDLREPFSILHYTGHGSIVGAGRYNPDDSRSSLTGEEVLILHEGMLFGALDIKYFRFGTHPLIVLNSCLTGRLRLYGGTREDLAGAFLRQGAESVIASVIPVGTEIGKIFGDQLYRQDEAEIQAAFLNARKETEKIAREYHSLFWPCWAFFALHGNPYARLPHVNS